MKSVRIIGEIYNEMKPLLYSIVGSFIITAGWNWYHLAYRPHWRFVAVSLLMWAFLFAAFQIFKSLYAYLTRRYQRHPFWQMEFFIFLDELFFISSLGFLIFFLQNEILSFLLVSGIFLFLFYRLSRVISRHPAAAPWLAVNKSVFFLGYFIFLFSGLAQYTAYHYYILDSNIRFYNIVIFRSFSITMFWLLGFAVAGFIYWSIRSVFRYVFFALWSVSFLLFMFFWAVNAGILIFASLYLSPFMFSQVEGAGGIWYSSTNILLIFFFLAAATVFFYVLKNVIRAHRIASARYWHFYNFAIAFIAISSLLGIASFKNTPEYLVARSFYQYFKGETVPAELSPAILQKLERFGLKYNLDEFFIAHKDKVYESEKKLLPAKFSQTRPNVVIVFLESFSARLTDPYSSRWKNLTPGLDRMAGDKNTTLFKNVYNASTPTVTGLLAELCSILPPTGHNEIQEEKRLQNHHLLCLPKILKDSAGYRASAYITAVDKNFANKGSIFQSMGVEEVLGKEELKKYISGPELSWGYSDHQMFPVLFQKMSDKPQPFFLMLSTVDTHPPFNVAKDIVPWGNSQSNLLNSIHTTDDAFGKFWDEFKASEFYENTIVIAVADHAVFPNAYDKVIFPEERKTATFYDELFFAIYAPDSVLPKSSEVYASSIDLAPTILQILGVNVPNAFEGHSIFDDRAKFPNLLGMHEYGLYINQISAAGLASPSYQEGAKGELPSSAEKLQVTSYKLHDTSFAVPSQLNCPDGESGSRLDVGTTPSPYQGEGGGEVNTTDYSLLATPSSSAPLTLCDFLEYYKWKRRMFEEGRFWER